MLTPKNHAVRTFAERLSGEPIVAAAQWGRPPVRPYGATLPSHRLVPCKQFLESFGSKEYNEYARKKYAPVGEENDGDEKEEEEEDEDDDDDDDWWSLDIKVLTFTDPVRIKDFDNMPTEHRWREIDDSQMGGKSAGTAEISDGILILDGNVAIVPETPSYISARTADNGPFSSKAFPDVSNCKGLSITAKSSTPYKGYRFSFGYNQAVGGNPLANGYKSRFDAPLNEFGTVKIPFEDFTNSWDLLTGDPLKTCKESPENCPDKQTLRNFKTVAFWGEGVEGNAHLEVQSVNAYGCTVEQGLEDSDGFQGGFQGGDQRFSAVFDGATDTRFVWQLAAVSFGLLVFYVGRIQARSTLTDPPLLLG